MIVIEGGILIDPSQGINAARDLLLADGIVQDIGQPGSFSKIKEATRVSAQGKWVVPGFIDVHVHLREPGFEWKETILSGSRAAVRGGYTTILCMPNTRPTNDAAEVSQFIASQARAANAAAVYPIGAVSLGLQGKSMAPLSELRKAGCVAFSDDGEPIFNSGLMRRALEWCRMLDVPICCHEEDKCLSQGGAMNESALSYRMGVAGWPKVAEEVMIARDIELARATGGKVHFCHVSTARGVELVRRAKQDGIGVTAEVCPHHLLLSQDRVRNYDTAAKMSPPLRDSEDCEALRKGLAEGVVDMVASDHAPHELDSKRVEFESAANGILGLQTSLPMLLRLVNSGELTAEQLVRAASCRPAEVFGFRDRGTLKRGSRADVSVIDRSRQWTLNRDSCESISSNSPWWGESMEGIATDVWVGGQQVVKDGVGAWHAQ